MHYRDRTLLGWIYDHHTLTTAQIAHALFTSMDFAQRRLLLLTGLGAITRFRPNKLDGGSYPYHYVLDQIGFTYIMGGRGEGLPRRDEARRLPNPARSLGKSLSNAPRPAKSWSAPNHAATSCAPQKARPCRGPG